MAGGSPEKKYPQAIFGGILLFYKENVQKQSPKRVPKSMRFAENNSTPSWRIEKMLEITLPRVEKGGGLIVSPR